MRWKRCLNFFLLDPFQLCEGDDEDHRRERAAEGGGGGRVVLGGGGGGEEEEGGGQQLGGARDKQVMLMMIVIGMEGVVNALVGAGGICWEVIQRYWVQIVKIGRVRRRFEHFLKAMCLGDQKHNYIANIETSHCHT